MIHLSCKPSAACTVLAVTGNTYPHRELLHMLGLRFDYQVRAWCAHFLTAEEADKIEAVEHYVARARASRSGRSSASKAVRGFQGEAVVSDEDLATYPPNQIVPIYGGDWTLLGEAAHNGKAWYHRHIVGGRRTAWTRLQLRPVGLGTVGEGLRCRLPSL